MKAVILSTDQTHLDSIRKTLEDGSNVDQLAVYREGLEHLPSIIVRERPDIVFLNGVCCRLEGLTELEPVLRNVPNLEVVLLCEQPSAELLMRAMRIGVKEVVPLPCDPQVLLAAVEHIEQKKVAVAARQQGRLLAFIPCKGGSGTTFLATNLAYILAEHTAARVALLDLNMQSGDAVLFVSDHGAKNSLMDVINTPSRMDASLLAAAMVQVLPNFSVLAAPDDPEHSVSVRPDQIDALVKLALDNYDYVIVDLDRTISATNVKVLDHADLIFPVLQLTLPFIRDSRRLVKTMESLGYGRNRIHLIVNRYQKGGDVQLKDVESTLGMSVYKCIPNSYETVSASVNQGIPIARMAKHDPVTKALQEMVHDLADVKQEKKMNWLVKLLHHL